MTSMLVPCSGSITKDYDKPASKQGPRLFPPVADDNGRQFAVMVRYPDSRPTAHQEGTRRVQYVCMRGPVWLPSLDLAYIDDFERLRGQPSMRD